MRARIFASAMMFLMVTMVSAPWLESESDPGIPRWNAAAPAADARLPPILTEDQLFGSNAQFPYQTHAYELAAKITKGCTSSRAIATAIAAWGTTACTVASLVRTGRNAVPA